MMIHFLNLTCDTLDPFEIDMEIAKMSDREHRSTGYLNMQRRRPPVKSPNYKEYTMPKE